jgi:hypothetical protein
MFFLCGPLVPVVGVRCKPWATLAEWMPFVDFYLKDSDLDIASWVHEL